MTKGEVLEFLEAQLEKLKEEHAADLMKTNRVEELEEIAKELQFEPLNEFVKENEWFDLAISEIPKGYHYELAFYISQSELGDDEIFEDYEDFIKLLEETDEELGVTIAAIMEWRNLSRCSIEELLSGELTEDDEEEE